MTKRVCILRQSAFPEDAHVRRNVDTLLDAGYEVDVVCAREPGENALDRYRGARVIRLPVRHRRGGALRYCFEYGAFALMALVVLTLRQPLRRYRTVEVYNLPDLLVMAAWPAHLMGARLLFSMVEVMPEQTAEQLSLREDHLLIRMLRSIQGVVVRSADAIVVVSPYDAELIARHRPRREPVMLPNSPSSALFSPPELGKCDSRSFRILTHGTLLPRYGIQTAIEALPAVLRSIPCAQLRIVGDGEGRPALESRVAELGLHQQVEFTGRLPYNEMPGEIAAADLCIVPAPVPWLLPNKLFEYAAMARPVLAARSPSIEGVFGDAIAYHTPADARDFALKVMMLHESSRERARLAAAAYTVYRRHDWRLVRSTYLSLYADLVRRDNDETA